MPLQTPRLFYRRLGASEVDAFHALAQDAHVRRFLLDGALLPREWAEAEVAASDRLFAERGLGLWLVAEEAGGPAIGFCGFRVFEEVEPAPQLLYALVEARTGRGYATEMARALVALAREVGLSPVRAGVDAVNLASLRVLEKIGFVRAGEVTGAFGPLLLLEI